MTHSATSEFWTQYRSLPATIQALARKNFRLLQSNLSHPSLRFKKVGRFWSARVGRNFRAVAVVRGDLCVWFWIGPHDEYLQLINS